MKITVVARHKNRYQSELWEWRHDCPYCEHPDDLHHVCRDCPSAPHALCSGRAKSTKDPLVYAPCHCSWIPGTPRKEHRMAISESNPDQTQEITNLERVSPEDALRILATFSELIQHLNDHPELESLSTEEK